MEVYKLGNIIENQGIEIQLILHKLDEAREELNVVRESTVGIISGKSKPLGGRGVN